MKKVISIFSVILLATVGLGIFSYFQGWFPFSVSDKEMTLITYQKYSNEKFNFELNYPQNWTVEEQELSSSKKKIGGIYEVKFQSPKLKKSGDIIGTYITTEISIYDNLDSLSLDQWINQYFETTYYYPIQKQKLKTTDKNIEGIEVIAQYIGKLKFVFFSKNELIYKVKFLYPIENQPYSEQANEIFDQFLNSLIIEKAQLEELKESDLTSTILYTESPLSFLYPQYWIKVPLQEINKFLEEQEKQAECIFYLIHPKERIIFAITKESFSPQKISFQEHIEDDIEKTVKESPDMRIENLEIKSDEAIGKIYFKDDEDKEVYSEFISKVYDLNWDESIIYSINLSMYLELKEKYEDFVERVLTSFEVSRF